ncbi:MAG: sporulation protein YunB [Eubacteriales bacterium]|nr:sporulation protein YunB [Eubacteriales bacterium]
MSARRLFKHRWKSRLTAILLAMIALAVAAVVLVEKNLLPVAQAMAEARVRAMALKAVNDSLRELLNGADDYTQIIDVVRDDAGKVTMVRANSTLLNDLSTRTALAAQDRISQMGTQGIGISLGSLFASQLLSGRGPLIYIRIVPVGAVSTEFSTEFEEAGINQTRLKILLNAKNLGACGHARGRRAGGCRRADPRDRGHHRGRCAQQLCAGGGSQRRAN